MFQIMGELAAMTNLENKSEERYPPRVWVFPYINEDGVEYYACDTQPFAKGMDEQYLSMQEHTAELDALKSQLAVAVEALEHTIHAAEYLYKPNAYLADGMDPTFYHTLTYAGDAALIEKTKKAREALAKLKSKKE